MEKNNKKEEEKNKGFAGGELTPLITLLNLKANLPFWLILFAFCVGILFGYMIAPEPTHETEYVYFCAGETTEAPDSQPNLTFEEFIGYMQTLELSPFLWVIFFVFVLLLIK